VQVEAALEKVVMGTHALRFRRRTAAIVAALVVSGPVAHAVEFPAKPVKVVTQGAPGSGPDVIVRIVAEQLGRAWSQPVAIVNHAGGGGVVAARAAAAAEPDGYTLYVPTITTFVILPELHDKLPFDLDRDFAPVGLVAETPMMIAVAPSLAVASLSALIALSKSRPGGLFYAANNRGSLPHLTGELFRDRTGSDLNFVPYAGVNAGLQDLMGGRVSMIVESVGALSGAIKGGTVKPLAVGSAGRLARYPGVPTVAETIPGFAAMGWFALMAPAGTPKAILTKVNADLNTALGEPELQRRLEDLGAFVRPMSPAEVTEFIRTEQRVWRPVVRQSGLKGQ
jgi:tripartite-type tricarboxylate transporter receptor subunit TctC